MINTSLIRRHRDRRHALLCRSADRTSKYRYRQPRTKTSTTPRAPKPSVVFLGTRAPLSHFGRVWVHNNEDQCEERVHACGWAWLGIGSILLQKTVEWGSFGEECSDGHHTSSIPMWMELSCVPAGDYIRQRSYRTSPREGGGWKTAFGENMPSQSGQTTHVPPGSFFFLDLRMHSAQRQL